MKIKFPIGRCPEADREYNNSRIGIGEQMPFSRFS
jgi:hypothetical protein